MCFPGGRKEKKTGKKHAKVYKLSIASRKLTVFDEQLFDGCSEHFDVLANLCSRIDQVGVDLVCQQVSGSDADGSLAPLGHLAQDDAKVGDRVLHRPLELLQVTSGVLDPWNPMETSYNAALVWTEFKSPITIYIQFL